MSTLETIESLQQSLPPLDALHSEHEQLESWIQESVVALDKLNEELTAWQADLIRQQNELDEREQLIGNDREQSPPDESHLTKIENLERQLSTARNDVEQLEAETVEQLQAIEELEQRHLLLETELKAANTRISQLQETLSFERNRAAMEQDQWKHELADLRKIIERQCELFDAYLRAGSSTEPSASEPVTQPRLSRTAEFRRRAQSRRTGKRAGAPLPDESNE